MVTRPPVGLIKRQCLTATTTIAAPVFRAWPPGLPGTGVCRLSWGLSRWDIGLMSVPGWPGRRAGLATGFAWDGSLPVEPVGVVLGRWPDVGTRAALPPGRCRAGAGLATGFAWDGSLPVEPVGVVLGHHSLPSAGVRLDAERVPAWPGVTGCWIGSSSQCRPRCAPGKCAGVVVGHSPDAGVGMLLGLRVRLVREVEELGRT